MSIGNWRKKNRISETVETKLNHWSLPETLLKKSLLTIESPLSESKAILLVYFCQKRNVVYSKS